MKKSTRPLEEKQFAALRLPAAEERRPLAAFISAPLGAQGCQEIDISALDSLNSFQAGLPGGKRNPGRVSGVRSAEVGPQGVGGSVSLVTALPATLVPSIRERSLARARGLRGVSLGLLPGLFPHSQGWP